MTTTFKPSDFEFEGRLSYPQAWLLEAALGHALQAMANYGTGDEEMMMLSALRVTALKHMHNALSRKQAEQASS